MMMMMMMNGDGDGDGHGHGDGDGDGGDDDDDDGGKGSAKGKEERTSILIHSLTPDHPPLATITGRFSRNRGQFQFFPEIFRILNSDLFEKF